MEIGCGFGIVKKVLAHADVLRALTGEKSKFIHG
jgi:hypothetical protein